MKKYLLKLIAVVVCLHGLAWTTAEHKQPTLTDFVAVFSVEHAKMLPQSISSAPVKDLIVTPKMMQFRLRGIPVKVEWIGERSRYMKLNGHVFSEHNLSNLKEFTRAFYAKFGIYRKRSNASVDATSALDSAFEEEEEAEEEKPASQYNFETMEKNGFTQYFVKDPKLFHEGSVLNDTQAGKEMQRRYELLAGQEGASYMMALFTAYRAFQFNLNAGMGRPANTPLGYIGPRPSAVADMPRF